MNTATKYHLYTHTLKLQICKYDMTINILLKILSSCQPPNQIQHYLEITLMYMGTPYYFHGCTILYFVDILCFFQPVSEVACYICCGA